MSSLCGPHFLVSLYENSAIIKIAVLSKLDAERSTAGRSLWSRWQGVSSVQFLLAYWSKVQKTFGNAFNFDVSTECCSRRQEIRTWLEFCFFFFGLKHLDGVAVRVKCEPQKSLCCFRRKWGNTAPYPVVLVMHKTETRSPGVLSQAQAAFGKPVWQDLEAWLSRLQSFCVTLCVTQFSSACCKNRLPQWLIWEWNWLAHTVPWDTLIE